MTLLTAGCGISQASFPHWPTWVKYSEITHSCKHINIGGPAAGNEFLTHTIIDAVANNNIDCAIIMWTEFTKTDLYIENQEIVDEITTYNLRNFVLNNIGMITNTAPCWWPSSVGIDNRIKGWMYDNIYSKFHHLRTTLLNIAAVQNVLNQKNIPYYMFLGYDIDMTDAEKYGIDLRRFVTLEPLEDNFYNSKWINYSTTKKYGMVPVAGWHWEFYKEQIMPIMNEYYPRSIAKLDKLEVAAYHITTKCFEKGVS